MAIRTQNLARLEYLPVTPSSISICADVIALVIGIGASLTVKLVGNLPLSEVILIPLAPIFFALRPARIFRSIFKVPFMLIGLWLFGQVITDIYRETKSIDWLRGDAKIVFLAVNILCMAVLVGRNLRRSAVFVGGYSIGSFLTFKFQPVVYSTADPWKFGYYSSVMMFFLLTSCYFYSRRRYAIVGIILMGLIVVNLLLNFRSPVAFLLITFVLVLPVIPERIGRMTILPRLGSVQRVTVLMMFALAATAGSLGLVHIFTYSGFLGEQAQLKNQNQSESKLGLLIGGRPEILVSSHAVWDSPILGHGSWATDMKYVDMLYDYEEKYGLYPNLEDMEEQSNDLIPSHSHLMAAWVESGFLGAIFWAFVLSLVVKSIIRVSTFRPPLAPLYTWLLLTFAWDILFSPFGSGRLISEGFLLVVICDLLESSLSSFKMRERSTQIGFLYDRSIQRRM
jgi:hypothetical protein